jgi:hypothetical protein
LALLSKRKLDLSSNPQPRKSVFSDFTRGYRQSSNVEDRRGKVADNPTATPKSREVGVYDTATPDDNSDDIRMFGGGKDTQTPTSTRKVSPEEAVTTTHRKR